MTPLYSIIEASTHNEMHRPPTPLQPAPERMSGQGI